MRLIDKQKTFSRLLARLITEAYSRGYEVTLGEAYRPPEVARFYAERAASGAGGPAIAASLHSDRLAADLNLFRDGRYLRRSDEYRELGELWESYSTDQYECAWGGRFGDGNHFSIAHGERR
jgi:hypothetical protein